MVTIIEIEALKAFVSSMMKKDDYEITLSDEKYEDELRRLYDDSTQRITADLERDIYLATQEDCEHTAAEFRRNMIVVQKRLKKLNSIIDNIGNSGSSKKDEIQREFCQKLYTFIRTLISKTDEFGRIALTIAEYTNTYYVASKQPTEALPLIYSRLTELNWIDASKTTEADFCYYFGGIGIKPINPICWNKSLAYLAAFIDLMTDDRKFLTKATRIFAVRSDSGYTPVLYNSLKQSRFRSMESDDETFWNYQDKIRSSILA